MTLEIGVLLAILAVMAVLFVTEKLPIEVTAFSGLVILVFGGYLDANEAFVGFASPAVITMLSIFFLSAALLHTGVADGIGVLVGNLFGSRELPLMAVVMLVAGALSAFMPNIAAVAVLLPAVGSVTRRAGLSPSRLFMPLSFGAILGGTTTLVGTPPNILAADLLRERGLEPFGLFAFTPLGLALLASGIGFMLVFGRKLLPKGSPTESAPGRRELVRLYGLDERIGSIRIPHEGSKLDGLTLAEAGLGTALGVQVLSIDRGGERQLAPSSDAELRGGDVLTIKTPSAHVRNLLGREAIEIDWLEPDHLTPSERKARGAIATVPQASKVVGKTLRELRFRDRFGALVLAIRREGELLNADIGDTPLEVGDEIFALLTEETAHKLEADLEVVSMGRPSFQLLQGRLFRMVIPEGSHLAGESLESARLDATGLTVVGIIREGQMPGALAPSETLHVGDELVVTGDPGRAHRLLALGEVELSPGEAAWELQSDDVGIVEATVAPRSRAAGRTLADMRFRDRYGLQVLAIWREAKPIHSELASRRLRFGDALLLQGPWEKLQLLGADPDFIVLATSAQQPRRRRKAPLALGGLVMMIALVVTGVQPVHVAAFATATFLVLSATITMEEAYRAVEWRAVFLVAAILPVGMAMERTGAAGLVAHSVTSVAGPLGPYAVLSALLALSSLLSQCLDGAPAVVLLAPVVLGAAEQLGISPYPLMMGVSLAASAAFMTPFSGKANLLVMGAGGYRVADYLRVGTPLTVIYLFLLAVLVPVFFPWGG